jgi:hypothetical protein
MSFATRTVISLLAGFGAGLLGFWAVWRCLVGSIWQSVPGPGYDAWFLAGIFVPGVLVPLVVFWKISQRATGDTVPPHLASSSASPTSPTRGSK